MAKRSIKAGTTSQREYVWIGDSASTTGGGKTGIAYNAAGIKAYYVRPGGTATAITLATQTVTGSFSSGGWVEVDSTNTPGLYRFDVPDAVFAAGAEKAVVMVSGASGMAPVVLEYELTAYDPYDTVRLGLTALPNVASGSAGAIITSGTGTGQLTVSSGAVTVGTNNDKTGYSLTQSFPSNFASLAITAGGSVTAGTVSDKTGYSLTQSFPSNFSSLAITAGGIVTANTTQLAGQTVTAAAGVTFPTSVASPTNITSATGIVLAATTHTGAVIPWNAAWDAEVQSEVQDAIEVNHLDHLLAATYDPASKPGAADSLFNDLVQDNGSGVSQFTTVALELAPSGGGGGTTDWTANERTAIRSILGIPTSGTTPTDPTTGILDTIRDNTVTIQADTDDIQSRLPAALVSGRMDASVGAMAANTLTASALATDAAAEVATAVRSELATELGRIDAAVSSRMATYTQPTGFLAATFPTTVASPTNITAASGITLAAVTHTGAVIPRVTLVDTTTTNTDMRGTDGAALASVWTSTRGGYLDSVVLAANANQRTVQITGSQHIAADIHDLQPAVIDNTHFATGAIDSNALAASAASEVATATLTTAMTESYRAAGVAPTLAQTAFELLAHMGDSAISGTTKTLNKLDGTTAKTFTLDSSTAPTSITEAT